MAIMAHAKFRFNRLMLTLTFGIWASTEKAGLIGSTYVLTTAKLNATGFRWVAELADFHFSIKYMPGDRNKVADLLSGMPSL